MLGAVQLYELDGVPQLLFKGGTSLSKCFGLIRRFSEDIDIGLERAGLGFSDLTDPTTKKSRNKRQAAVKELRSQTRAYIQDEFLPLLEGDFSKELNDEFGLEIDAEQQGTILFRYPRCLEGASYGATGSYVEPVIRIEMGSRSDHHPTESVEICSFVAEEYPDCFTTPRCEVIAQSASRTFVEKALIVHTANKKKRFGSRSSRHLYDLYCMESKGLLTMVDDKLYREVANHKLHFADDRHARKAPTEGIQVVPRDPECIKAVRSDYNQMSDMFFDDRPNLEDIFASLLRIEEHLK